MIGQLELHTKDLVYSARQLRLYLHRLSAVSWTDESPGGAAYRRTAEGTAECGGKPASAAPRHAAENSLSEL